MRTYQFEFRPERGATLLVDIDALTEDEAITVMRAMAEDWCDDEDPTLLDERDPQIYARVWINIKPETITADDIIEQWEHPND
jgi:hypothetical protein